MDQKMKIYQSIIDDLLKMPKADKGDSAMEVEIEPKDDAEESPMEQILSGGDDDEDKEKKEPEMDFDDEGPLGGAMRGSSSPMVDSKPSFGKGRRR